MQCPDGLHGTIQTEEALYETVDPDHVNDAVGPIYVEGALPGDILAVEIERVTMPVHQAYILLRSSQGYSFEDAYTFTSLVGNLRISRVVDPWMTVRMSIKKDFLSQPLIHSGP